MKKTGDKKRNCVCDRLLPQRPDQSFARAKTTMPKCTTIVPRVRLFRLLDDCKDQPVAWVCGPAGSGKTSLVASYLQQRKIPLLWYKIDAGDVDVGTFFYYLGVAAEKSHRRHQWQLPFFNALYQQDITTFARRFFEQLCQGLRNKSVLVFDDYQQIAKNAQLHEIMCHAISAVPENIRVVVISRELPPPRFSRLQVHQQIRVIRWQELQLLPEESYKIINSRLSYEATEAFAQQLHLTANGWVAGLVMLIESSKSGGVMSEIIQPSVELFDYFAIQVFEQMESRTQRILMSTSMLQKVTDSMAHALSGIEDAGTMLASLCRTGYFTTKHGKNDSEYEYHPLFREFLKRQAVLHFPREEWRKIRLQAAELLAETGQPECAMTLFEELKAWDKMIRLVLLHAADMTACGRTRTLSSWLAILPESILKTDAWLLYWLGVTMLNHGQNDGKNYLEYAFQLFKKNNNLHGQLFAWSWIVDSIFNCWDDLTEIDPWIEWLEQQLAPPLSIPNIELKASLTASMLNALTARRPQQHKICNWIKEGERILRENQGNSAGFKVGTSLIICYMWLGEYDLAHDVIARIGMAATAPNASPLTVLTYKWASAGLQAFQFQTPGQCRLTAQKGLDFASRTGIHHLDFLLYGDAVMGALAEGDYLSAKNFLTDMIHVTKGKNGHAFYHFLVSWHSYLQGNRIEAMVHCERALALAIESGTYLPETLCRLAIAGLLIELARFEEAEQHLSAARKTAEGFASQPLIFSACLTTAHLCFTRRAETDEEKGLEELRKAMMVGSTNGFVYSYWWVPQRMSSLCLKSLETDIEVEYVRRLIALHNLMPNRLPYHCRAWPWRINIITLGRFNILRNSQQLQFPAKAPKKGLMLLKLLIAAGGEAVSIDKLQEYLWPDSDGDMAYRSFVTTLHRLRKILGIEDVILFRDGHLSINRGLCQIDAHAFTSLLDEGDQHFSLDQIKLIEQAVMLYHGDFLPDLMESWTISYRKQLRNRFVKAIRLLGEHSLTEQAYNHGVNWFERGLEVDCLAEPLYRGLIRCHLAAGHHAEAVLAYRRCQTLLRLQLQIEPSRETTELLNAIPYIH